MNRRQFLATPLASRLNASDPGEWVNDIHSQLNRTHVSLVLRPDSPAELARAITGSTRLSIAGGRHAMGGQQFGAETTLIDMRAMSRSLNLDVARGVIEVEAGILWPQLLDYFGKDLMDGEFFKNKPAPIVFRLVEHSPPISTVAVWLSSPSLIKLSLSTYSWPTVNRNSVRAPGMRSCSG